jgi:hypothetical protein
LQPCHAISPNPLVLLRPPLSPPQLLDRAASAQVRIEAARQAAELSARHHLDLAGSTFEILKGIFGNKGPCAMPREQVLTQLRGRTTSKSGLSPADADEQLRLMLRLLPGWIRVDHPPGISLADMRVVVRIHRRTPWADLRRQLSERVAAARAEAVPQAGQDAEAAAAAEAADLAAAALDAAVARAAAAAAAQEGSGGEGAAAGGSCDGDEADAGGEGAAAEGENARAAADQQHRQQPSECAGPSSSAQQLQGQVAPEALSACLKARVWGQQRAGGAADAAGGSP